MSQAVSGAVVKESAEDAFFISKAIQRKAGGAEALRSLPSLLTLQLEVVGNVIIPDDDKGETQASRQGTSREDSLRDRKRRSSLFVAFWRLVYCVSGLLR